MLETGTAVERELLMDFVRVTEAAALRAASFMGKGTAEAAARAAVDGMLGMFSLVNIDGVIKHPQGKPEFAPLLDYGTAVGRGVGPKLDVVPLPIDGSRLVALGLPNALSVLVVARRGSFHNIPTKYVLKLAVGPKARGHIDLSLSIRDNLRIIARVLRRKLKHLTVAVLDRPRNQPLINEVLQTGVRIKLISDGDVAAGLAAALEYTGVDALYGIGGAMEAVVTAAALKCLEGEIQVQPWPLAEEEVPWTGARLPVLTTEQLICGEDLVFCATGITDGDILHGVRYYGARAVTHSIVLRAKTGTLRVIETSHNLRRKTLRSQRTGREVSL
ncbi:MAG TPA: fructose-bisphosphatase class II family protein [Firmicutes bacterium]|jgi:fructose-1,6-bisphosphatase II|nr:fructose-bisphosphatase class II family protein [Bacillota bacterium]